MMQQRAYYTLPPIVNGYPLDDRIFVIIPVQRINLCTNGSFETNTTLWAASGGGSIARSTVQQYHGAYSLQISPSAATADGASYDTVALVSGTTYAYSAKVRGVAGLAYTIGLYNTAGNVALSTVTFTASGRWQWVYGYYTETSSTGRRFSAIKAGHASTANFYLDGVQVEAIAAGETVSTYLDGSQQGLVPNQNPPAYWWNGTPHGSTSVRSALTRAGGMVIPFKQFGFFLTALIGLGLAPPQNVGTEYARIDGGYDDYTRKPSRQFTVQGNFESLSGNYLTLRQQRGGLSRLLDRDLVAQDQRLILLRDVADECGNVDSTTCRLIGKYQGGLDGQTDNHVASVAPITFTQYLGVVLADGESGSSLAVQQSLSNANAIVQRSSAGVWSALGTGMTGGNVLAIAVGIDGKIYAGGTYTGAGGVGSTNHIAVYTPSSNTWAAMGTGSTGNAVYTLSVAPDGAVIAGGDIATNFGGVATTANLARWTIGGTWQSITPAGTPNGIVTCSAFDSNGNLYVGGTFTTINAVAANRIAKMTPAGTWSALSTGSSADVNAIVADKAGNIYAASTGTFGGAVPIIAKWNGTAFSSVGSTLNAAAYSLALDSAFNLYGGGSFTAAGAITLSMIGKTNRVEWQPLSAGITPGGGTPAVFAMLYSPTTNLLYVGGDSFATASGVTPIDNFLLWNGAQFLSPDINLPGTPRVNALAIDSNATVYVGFNTTGTATAAGTTAVTNPGSARSYPTIVLTGPTSGSARLYQIINTTTGRAIYTSLTMLPGETITMVFTPDNLSFQSTFMGDVSGGIMPGSNTADFFLQPGINNISVLAGDSTVTANIFFRPTYASLDDVP
jgi:hypothetical protein